MLCFLGCGGLDGQHLLLLQCTVTKSGSYFMELLNDVLTLFVSWLFQPVGIVLSLIHILFHRALLRLLDKSDGASLPCLIAFICSIRAVSYTHLDVYKRQIVEPAVSRLIKSLK